MADKSKPVYQGTRSRTNGNGSVAGVNSLAAVPNSPGNRATPVTVTTATSEVRQFFHGPTVNMVNSFSKPGSYDLNFKYADNHGGPFSTAAIGSAPANSGGSPRPQ